MAWYVCKVGSVGPAEDGDVFIKLDDEGDGWSGLRWFKATGAVRKEMLAVALTALPLGLLVQARLASATEYSLIERLYIRRSA
ncbi:hypothetical protein ACFQZZ_07020 [Nocardia sp. GCM10030253]|uniref:hypothetical protein n=1 Tax=Nocardia sp. GCM10030253 TaxID=3273404 RepID=UPI0036334A8C